jgi:stearoyl-CoA desaturase (Delta-9 desaturase)
LKPVLSIPVVVSNPQPTTEAAPLFRPDTKARWVIWATVFGPPAGVVALAVPLWGRGVTLTDVVLLVVLYSATVFGVTAGFHRLFAHRSYECKQWFRALVAIFGCMAAEGPICFWVATHREHHTYSDTKRDPHSPHGFGTGVGAVLRGWWHSHMGWMLNARDARSRHQVSDLRRDRIVTWCDRRYLIWVVGGLLLPALVAGLIGGSWIAALRGFVWGGLLRVLLVHHVTWSVNSICHMVGDRPHDVGDLSRNNFWCAIFSFGEGWHNNHHAFPGSARHGHTPGQIDMTYWVLKLLEKAGVVRNLRLPKPSPTPGSPAAA